VNAFTAQSPWRDASGPQQTQTGASVLLWCVDRCASIDTSNGPQPAAGIQPGDTLLAPDSKPIAVLSASDADFAHDPAHDRRSSWPHLVRAHAFADGQPNRDTRVTCASMIEAYDTTAAVRQIANGATILRPAPKAPELWRILLGATERSTTLRVNGLAIRGEPVTADLDHAFAAPDLAPSPPFDLPPCAAHAPLRRHLADRALILGHTAITDPGLMLRAGSRLIAPDCEGAWCRFTLRPGMTPPPHRVTLLSRSATPHNPSDKRHLGVAISRVIADSRAIDLNHWTLGEGWHDPEPGWRWTNGTADLMVPPGTRSLAFEIANTLPAYSLPQRNDIPLWRETLW
jgi:hypothetical protein